MANPIRSGRTNFVGYRSFDDLDLASAGVVTGSNTNCVFRANADGTWSSYRPGRSINGFTTMSNARVGTSEPAGQYGSCNVYLLEATANFNITEQYPYVTANEGSGSSPSNNADDVAYVHTISGFDRIPNFAMRPGATTVNSAASGNWSSGSTWSGGVAPAAGTIVRIRSGHTVTVDTTISNEFLVVSVENGGTLQHSVSANTELRTRELLVRENGTYTIGTPASPVPNGTTARLVITDVALDTSLSTFDPNQYGNGLIVLGSFTACGYDRDNRFIRLASEIASTGATSCTLESAATNWQVGDRVAIPDTTQDASAVGYTPKWEVRTISSFGGTNATINFSSALTYVHKGARGSAGGAVEYCPHLLNLTSNVTIESESPAGTRGHCLFSSHARIDVRRTKFYRLGRTTSATLNSTTFDGSGNPTAIGTNQIGRYPVHFHHCGGREAISYDAGEAGTSWQYLFLDNVVDGGDDAHTFKWGLTVHGTHFGLIKNNAVYNVEGGGFVLEDGSESGNHIERNFALRVTGNSGREDGDDATTGFARNGAGFWVRSGLSHFLDNYAANCYGYGLIFNAIQLASVQAPDYPGAHFHSGSTAGTTLLYGYQIGIWEFDGFECYGGIGQGGMTAWSLNSAVASSRHQAARSVFDNCVFWHFDNSCVYFYETCNVTARNWIFRGDWDVMASQAISNQGIYPGDYLQTQFRAEGCDFRAAYIGMEFSPFSQDNCTFLDCNCECVVGLLVQLPSTPGGGTTSAIQQRPRVLRADGCTLTPTSAPVHFSMTKREVWYNNEGSGTGGYVNYVVQMDVYVLNKDGNPNQDYRLYSLFSNTTDTLTQTSGNHIACPEAGLTNQQAHDKYQPYDVDVGASTPVKPDNPNPNTPGLCYLGTLCPAGTTQPSWVGGSCHVETL